MAVYRIILVKHKSEVSAAQRAAFIAGLRSLVDTVPELKAVKSGRKVPHEADGGWEEGAILVFDNLEDLHTYDAAEPHVKFVKDTHLQLESGVIFNIEE